MPGEKVKVLPVFMIKQAVFLSAVYFLIPLFDFIRDGYIIVGRPRGSFVGFYGKNKDLMLLNISGYGKVDAQSSEIRVSKAL